MIIYVLDKFKNMPDMRTSNPLVIFCARRNSQAAHRRCLVIMDPSDMKDELDSLLEASFTWATEDVLTDAYFLNESGEEVKETTDICAHVGCNSHDQNRRKPTRTNFKVASRNQKLWTDCVLVQNSTLVKLKEGSW